MGDEGEKVQLTTSDPKVLTSVLVRLSLIVSIFARSNVTTGRKMAEHMGRIHRVVGYTDQSWGCRNETSTTTAGTNFVSFQMKLWLRPKIGSVNFENSPIRIHLCMLMYVH